MDDIAAAAGFTVGALYANFRSKDGLLAAVLDRHLSEDATRLQQLLDDTPPSRRLAALAQYFDELTKSHRPLFLLSQELWLHALRASSVRVALAAHAARCQTMIADAIRRHFDELDQTLPVPCDRIAAVVSALTEGLLRRHLLDPRSVSAADFGVALHWLFSGIAGSDTPRRATSRATRRARRRE